MPKPIFDFLKKSLKMSACVIQTYIKQTLFFTAVQRYFKRCFDRGLMVSGPPRILKGDSFQW